MAEQQTSAAHPLNVSVAPRVPLTKLVWSAVIVVAFIALEWIPNPIATTDASARATLSLGLAMTNIAVVFSLLLLLPLRWTPQRLLPFGVAVLLWSSFRRYSVLTAMIDDPSEATAITAAVIMAAVIGTAFVLLLYVERQRGLGVGVGLACGLAMLTQVDRYALFGNPVLTAAGVAIVMVAAVAFGRTGTSLLRPLAWAIVVAQLLTTTVLTLMAVAALTVTPVVVFAVLAVAVGFAWGRLHRDTNIMIALVIALVVAHALIGWLAFGIIVVVATAQASLQR